MIARGALRWSARAGDRVLNVEISPGADGTVVAVVDGRSYTLSVTEPQPLVFSILAAGVSHEAIVQMRQGRCRVRIGARTFEMETAEPGKADLRGGAEGAGPGGRAVVRAVMPGRVLRVMAAAGERVGARQGLVVVEAMKMENEIGAPREGVVREIKVQPGRTVETGDVLAVIE